jgi:hypothetical protein
MRAAKAKVAALHPKAKDEEVEAQAKALALHPAKDEGGTRPQRRTPHPRPSPQTDPAIRKERATRNLPLLTMANAATVASMATSPVTAANASTQNQRKVKDRQTTVSLRPKLPSTPTKMT